MVFHRSYFLLLGGVLLLASPAAPQTASPAPPVPGKTAELLEDLRVLALVNALEPSRDQLNRLAEVAETGKTGVAALEVDVKGTLDRQREALLAAREALLRGDGAPSAADAQIASAGRSAEATRAQKLDALIVSLAQRVHAILTPEQARRIESDLAPVGDQPWRLYGRGAGGAAALTTAGTRLSSDPGTWRTELRTLRARAATGDPQAELEAFTRKLTAGVRSGTPLFDQSATQARAIAAQALALSPAAFTQREWALARTAAKLKQDARNQQRHADGKEPETFDADRWLVEQVMLSPRTAATLRGRADGQ
jgi:hypothetical protein